MFNFRIKLVVQKSAHHISKHAKKISQFELIDCVIREEEENNLPEMKKLFFLYVWLNLTRIAELRKEDLVKHIRKRTIQTGRLFFSSSLISCGNGI